MPAKKRIIPFFIIFTILLISACSGSEDTFSPNKISREKEKTIDLLNSNKETDIDKAFEKIEEFDLGSDPDICTTLAGMLTMYLDDPNFVDFLFLSLNEVPDGNFPALNNILIEQYETAFIQGQTEIQDKLLAAILRRGFTPDNGKFDHYYKVAFEQTDKKNSNQYLQIAGKYADQDTLKFVLNEIKRTHYFNYQITNETRQSLDFELFDKLTKNESLSGSNCESLDSLQSATNHIEFMQSQHYILNDHEIRIIGEIYSDAVWTDMDFYNKCASDSAKEIAHDLKNILEVADPDSARDYHKKRLLLFEGVEAIDEFGTDNEYSEIYKLKYQTIKLLIDSMGEEKDDFLHDYFVNHYKSDGYLINRKVIVELVDRGYQDIGPQIQDVILSIHDLDWSDIQWINNYDFHFYEQDFDIFDPTWFHNVGLMMNYLRQMDTNLAIETASILMNDKLIYDDSLGHPGTEEYWTMRDLHLPIGDFKKDTIVMYIVKLITENNIEMNEERINLLRSKNENEIAEHRLMQIFRQLGLEKEKTINFYAKYLDAEDPETVFNTARMLENELEADPQIFLPYYEDKNLAIIAGAYVYAGDIVEKELIKEAMEIYGDKDMASHFLNNHGAWLSQASQEWAEANGFDVIEFNF